MEGTSRCSGVTRLFIILVVAAVVAALRQALYGVNQRGDVERADRHSSWLYKILEWCDH